MMRSLLALTALTAVAAGHAAAPAAADPCPNAAVRAAQGTSALPDCRAFEKVTPADKGGADVGGVLYEANGRAANGGTMLFSSTHAFADSPSAAFPSYYFGRRGPSGWSVRSALPASRSTNVQWFGAGAGRTATVLYVDDSLRTEIVESAAVISDTAIDGTPSIYARDPETGATSPLTPGVPSYGLAFAGPLLFSSNLAPVFEAATPDGKTVLFISSWVFPDRDELPSYDPTDFGRVAAGRTLYAAVDGEVKPAVTLPDGSPALGAHVGSFLLSADRAISEDGSRIYFMLGSETSDFSGPLYISDQGVTTEIAAAGASFYTATRDGSKAAYLKGGSAYVYDHATGDSELISGAGYVPTILAASDDLRRIYFTSQGADLVPGHPTGGERTIYLWDHGELKHIATLADNLDMPETGPADRPYGVIPVLNDWRSQRSKAWTPDGESFAFATTARVTDYDPKGYTQVYRYDVSSDAVRCVSCPDGAPTADAHMVTKLQPVGTHARNLGARGSMTPDGTRVFFETGDGLVPDDVDGRVDVYVFQDGERRLLTPGTNGADARFVAASPDGKDVYFATASRLVRSDRDELVDIYDARVEGGKLEPDEERTSCAGDSCQGPLSDPRAFDVPGSAKLEGAGNASGRQTGVAKPRAARRVTVHGSSARIAVRVGGKGRIRASGRGIRRASRGAGSAGEYRVSVHLSERGRLKLRRDGRVTVRVAVRFTVPGRGSATTQVAVTFKADRKGR